MKTESVTCCCYNDGKNGSNTITLLLGWSHRNTNSTAVITSWLIVLKYPFLKRQLIFSPLCRFCIISITAKSFTGSDYMSNTASVLYEKGASYLSRTAWVHSRFFGWISVAHIFSFLCCAFWFVFFSLSCPLPQFVGAICFAHLFSFLCCVSNVDCVSKLYCPIWLFLWFSLHKPWTINHRPSNHCTKLTNSL